MQNNDYQQSIKEYLEDFLSKSSINYIQNEVFRIDLHCHDLNSSEPDEVIGRILNIPETWTSTDFVVKELKKNKADIITITNHNNAKSCYELQSQGEDVLTAAEFSCYVPDYDVKIHVLTYGFDQKQEEILNKRRRNFYLFMEYCHQQNIPTIWAHPLYHPGKKIPTIDFFEKMSVIFNRFEVINGQHDNRQNALTIEWLKTLTPAKIDLLIEKYQIDISKYTNNPYKKSFSGGSDSHMGIFAGQIGTQLYIPQKEQLTNKKISELALDAIRDGRMFPYGDISNEHKFTISLIDYICQIIINAEDPGLLRILLHNGNNNNKFIAFLAANAFQELRNHKATYKFIEIFHKSIMGKKPKYHKKWLISNDYQKVFDIARKIADVKKQDSNQAESYIKLIVNIHNHLVTLFFKRLQKKIDTFSKKEEYQNFDINTFISKLEIPSELRALTGLKSKKDKNNKGLFDFFDDLSFPSLASSFILAAHFTCSKVLTNNRVMLEEMSSYCNKFNHPKRLLWLTDTFDDKNGISIFLQTMHKEIKTRNLPIDILVCSKTAKPDEHLIVIKPEMEIKIPMYENQNIRIPNFLELHTLFEKNSYDRVVCSTEGIMGLASIYLKHAFNVPSYFYLHTDWVMFARQMLELERKNLNRFRRILRGYYKLHDGLFVLNNDQHQWLTGREMKVNPENVFKTAHWVDKNYSKKANRRQQLFGITDNTPVLLFAGRISQEKGINDVIDVYKETQKRIPNLKLAIAGIGPSLKVLRTSVPDALFLGWMNQEQLPDIYSSCDLLILPSKFDTFGCVILEAISCGLPVLSYNAKGPKDIIIHNECGYIAENLEQMTEYCIQYFSSPETHVNFGKNAIERAKHYQADDIIDKFLKDIKL